MGAGASTYLDGKPPARVYKETVYPENRDTLEGLGMSYDDGLAMFELFCEIDEDASEAVSVGELHAALGIPPTKFSERVFGVLDEDGAWRPSPHYHHPAANRSPHTPFKAPGSSRSESSWPGAGTCARTTRR